MKCPKCGLYSPDNSIECECGYHFKNDDINLNRDYFVRKGNKLIFYGIFIMIIGFAIAFFLGRTAHFLTGIDIGKTVGGAIFVFASSGGLIYKGYRIFKRGLMLRK